MFVVAGFFFKLFLFCFCFCFFLFFGFFLMSFGEGFICFEGCGRGVLFCFCFRLFCCLHLLLLFFSFVSLCLFCFV